jgi:fatty-acyl-CoA synthase
MALVVLQPGATFDAAAYWAFATRALPAYARPLFVRIGARMDVTGTLKHTKTRLQAEGFDPAAVGDPLWFRDDAARSYVRLDTALKQRIDSGAIAL